MFSRPPIFLSLSTPSSTCYPKRPPSAPYHILAPSGIVSCERPGKTNRTVLPAQIRCLTSLQSLAFSSCNALVHCLRSLRNCSSRKQGIVTKSSTESELAALSDSCNQRIHMRRFLMAQGYEKGPMEVLMCAVYCVTVCCVL